MNRLPFLLALGAAFAAVVGIYLLWRGRLDRLERERSQRTPLDLPRYRPGTATPPEPGDTS